MADYIPLNPVVTTTSNDSWNPVIYAKTYLAQEHVLPITKGIFTDYSYLYNGEGRGSSFKIPIVGASTVTDVPTSVTGNQGATQITPEDPADDEKTITLNKWRSVNFLVRKDVSAFIGQMIVRAKLEEAAGAMNEDFDSYILGLYASFNVHSTEATTSDTTTNLRDHWIHAKQLVDTAKVPQMNRVNIIDPLMESRLLTVEQATSLDYRPNDNPFELGYFSRPWLGSPTFVTPLLTTATVSAVTTHYGLHVHRTAIGFIIAFSDFESEYSVKEKGTLYSFDILYGATVVMPTRGIIVTATS